MMTAVFLSSLKMKMGYSLHCYEDAELMDEEALKRVQM